MRSFRLFGEKESLPDSFQNSNSVWAPYPDEPLNASIERLDRERLGTRNGLV